jgi:hypothetical protein
MPYISKVDISSHLYLENLDEITRGDDSLVTRSINAGISEVKGYLSRFHLVKLFDPADGEFVQDENLKFKTLDVVCWQLVTLANPNISLEVMEKKYDDAIRWLRDIQKGIVDPEGWPYRPDDPAGGFPEGNTISMVTSPKRKNGY